MDIINDFPPKKNPRQILSPPGKHTRATFCNRLFHLYGEPFLVLIPFDKTFVKTGNVV